MTFPNIFQLIFENPGTAYLIMAGVTFSTAVLSETVILARRFDKSYLLSAVFDRGLEIGCFGLVTGAIWPATFPLLIARHL